MRNDGRRRMLRAGRLIQQILNLVDQLLGLLPLVLDMLLLIIQSRLLRIGSVLVQVDSVGQVRGNIAVGQVQVAAHAESLLGLNLGVGPRAAHHARLHLLQRHGRIDAREAALDNHGVVVVDAPVRRRRF